MKLILSLCFFLTFFCSFGQDIERNKNNRVRIDGPGSHRMSSSNSMTFIILHKNKKLKIPENGNVEDSVAMSVLREINPEWIKSMDLLKGQQAAKYDSINKNGVMLVKLKKGTFRKIPRRLRKKFD